MDILQISIRTVLSYFILVFCLRIMGKREIGQLSLFDLIILLSIADIMIIGIENYNDNWMLSLVPVLILTLLQKLVSLLLLKKVKARKIIDGEISIIIKEGKICLNEMKKQSYNIEDLMLQLRTKDIYDIRKVSLAILETNGNLSVYTDSLNEFCPIPVIISGEINKTALEISGINEEWIVEYLGNNHLSKKDILCAYLSKNHLEVIDFIE